MGLVGCELKNKEELDLRRTATIRAQRLLPFQTVGSSEVGDGERGSGRAGKV